MNKAGSIGHVARLRTQRLHSSDLRARPPLVSCIMPTSHRRVFVPQAIAYFLRQDYPQRELIVVDDGTAEVADLIPRDGRIRYIRLTREPVLGVKRNIACEVARGEIIVHWDDDDWMADWRLTYQVAELWRQQADVCGLTTLLHYDVTRHRAWQYDYPAGGTAWVAGCTLCYTRAFWKMNPFPAVQFGEDTQFLWSPRPKLIRPLPDNHFLVAMIHQRNISPKQTDHFRWQPYPTEAVRGLLGDDWSFYTDAHRFPPPA